MKKNKGNITLLFLFYFQTSILFYSYCKHKVEKLIKQNQALNLEIKCFNFGIMKILSTLNKLDTVPKEPIKCSRQMKGHQKKILEQILQRKSFPQEITYQLNSLPKGQLKGRFLKKRKKYFFLMQFPPKVPDQLN